MLNFLYNAAISIVIIITKSPVCTNGEFHTPDSIHTFISHFIAVDSQLKNEVDWLRIHIYMCTFKMISLWKCSAHVHLSLSDHFKAILCSFLKIIQDQLYSINMQCVIVQELWK